MKSQTFNIAVAQSNIDWTGRKVTGAHNGTIAIKSGQLILQDGKLTGGNFVIEYYFHQDPGRYRPATNASVCRAPWLQTISLVLNNIRKHRL